MRLTKEDILDVITNGQTMFLMGRTVGKTITSRLLSEMYQYKSLEDELDIDLITLFKALKNGIWLKDKLKEQFLPYHCLLRDDFILVLYEDIYKEEYLLKDYGKTWALTKEELL